MGQATNEIRRAYEAAQNAAFNLRDRRQASLYKALPRVVDIDRELAQLGLALVRLSLSQGGDVQERLAAVRAGQEALTQEKAALMAAQGIPENYLTDIYHCGLCEDTGFINATTRCACFTQQLIDRYYTMSSLGEVLARENFANFTLKYYSERVLPDEGLSPRKNMERLRKAAEDFAKNFYCEASNLLFYGPTGLGKTFLCHCIAKAALDAGHTVLYITAPRLFKMVQAMQFSRGTVDDVAEKLDAVETCDLLILDDLGAEFSTVVTDSALFDVLNQRLLDRRSTVISTNLSMGELEEQYTERIISRVVGNYRRFKFFGDDIRVKQRELSLV